MTDTATVRSIYERLTHVRDTDQWETTSMDPYTGQPFKALIAAMLSAQTREEATAAASEALFAFADTPEKVLAAGEDRVRDAIRPASFYANKARYVMGIAAQLIEQHGGAVPNDLDALQALPGVGWKVATLVRYIAFGSDDNICVDVHVDRIAKRLGLIDPALKQNKKVGQALEAVVPREYYGDWNALMVIFGRNICRARGPLCGECPLNDLCPRIGVE